jgi:hypothetical protein
VHRIERVNCLELKDQPAFHDQVEPGFADWYAFVFELHGILPRTSDSAQLQLWTNGVLVHALEQPGAELAMDFDERADHSLGIVLRFRRSIA